MFRYLGTIVLALGAIVLLNDCEKTSDLYDAYFYTSDSNLVPYLPRLYIDNNAHTNLKYIPYDVMSIQVDSLLRKTYHTKLEEGKHFVEVRDRNNNILVKFDMKLNSNLNGQRYQVSGNAGSVEPHFDELTLYFNLGITR